VLQDLSLFLRFNLELFQLINFASAFVLQQKLVALQILFYEKSLSLT